MENKATAQVVYFCYTQTHHPSNDGEAGFWYLDSAIVMGK
jgi:hypothetical protein